MVCLIQGPKILKINF